jgi:chromosome segregation ATPase
MKTRLLISAALLLAGCAPHKQSVNTGSQPVRPGPVAAAAPQFAPAAPVQSAESQSANRIQECKKELAALKAFNVRSYEKYQGEYDAISRETQKYIKYREELGDDINYLVMPKYQFAIRNVCFRIKSDLSTSILSQIK